MRTSGTCLLLLVNGAGWPCGTSPATTMAGTAWSLGVLGKEGSVPGGVAQWPQPVPEGRGLGTPVQPGGSASVSHRTGLPGTGEHRSRTSQAGHGGAGEMVAAVARPSSLSPPSSRGTAQSESEVGKNSAAATARPGPAPAGRGCAQLTAPPPAPARPKIAGAGVMQPPRSHGKGPFCLLMGALRQHSFDPHPAPSAAPRLRDKAMGASQDCPIWGWLHS